MAEKITIVGTGDSLISMRIPENGYEGFQELSDFIGKFDVRFCNLETTVHCEEGYPSAMSGGSWTMASPAMLDDICRFHFNIFSTANNHTYDWGIGGLEATLKYLDERKLPHAGSGKNLETAARPCYVDTENGRVALIAAATTFFEHEAAGEQRPDCAGRPGVNPLGHSITYQLPKEDMEKLAEIAERAEVNSDLKRKIRNGFALPVPEGKLRFGNLLFEASDHAGFRTEPKKRDMDRMLREIRFAKGSADYVIVSLHSHNDRSGITTIPAEFYETACRKCIDAGATVVFGHGPHQVRGVEKYHGGIIFYSLGNFILETDTLRLQPDEAYAPYGLGPDGTPADVVDAMYKKDTIGYVTRPEIWRAVLTGLTIEDGKLTEAKLYPIDLGFGTRRTKRGIPKFTKDETVLREMAELSRAYDTEIEISDGVGTVRLD